MAKVRANSASGGGGVNPSPALLSNPFTTSAGANYTQYFAFDLTGTGYSRVKGKVKTDTYNGAYIFDSGSYVSLGTTTSAFVDFDITIPSGAVYLSFAVNNNRNAYASRVYLKDLEWS